METTPNLNLPLLDSTENVSEDHKKINEFVKAFDARLGEITVTLASLAVAGHSHEMAKINGLAEALAQLAPLTHGHKLNDLSDVDVTDAPDNSILQYIAGQWSLGQRGYSVSEINNIVTQLADGDHTHPIGDVQGLAQQLAKFADATKNAKFRKALSVLGDLYLNNKAIIANDSEGEFADRSGLNIDHIWHDDGANAWHLVSDGPYRSRGNTELVAGRLDLFRDNLSTNAGLDLLRVENHSAGGENITANRTQNGAKVINNVRPPVNASFEDGRRFYSAGLRGHVYNEGTGGDAYEVIALYGYARHNGNKKTRALFGGFTRAITGSGSGGTVSYAYGVRSEVVMDGAHVETAVGQHIHVNPTTADASVDNARGIYTHMNYDAGTVTEDPIALYQNYDGSWDGKKRIGIYQNEVQENRLTGRTYINGDEVIDEGNLKAKLKEAGVSGGKYQYVKILTSSGNFTVPSGVTKLFVILSGSGGGSSNNSNSGSGARPGCVSMQVTPGQVIPCTIGGRRKQGNGYNSTFGNAVSKGGKSHLTAPDANTGMDFNLPYTIGDRNRQCVASFKALVYGMLTTNAIDSLSKLRNMDKMVLEHKSTSSKREWSGEYPPGVHGSVLGAYSEGGLALIMY